MRDRYIQDVLDRVLETSTEPLIILDLPSLNLVTANLPAQQLWELGREPNKQPEKTPQIDTALAGRLGRILGRISNSGHLSRQFRLRIKQGSSAVYLVQVRFAGPNAQCAIVGATKESTENSKAELAKNRLRVAIEALPDGFVYYDSEDKMVICNQRYREIYPQSASAMVVGARFEDILKFGLENGQYADGIGREADWLKERLLDHQVGNSSIEQELGDGRWLRIDERKTSEGGHVGLRVDITELKKQQKELWQAARTDELTGALNRRGLLERLSDLTQSLAHDERIAIMHIDLHRFKSINDVLGHDAGDFVLRYCAQILTNAQAASACVARVGGDEFILATKSARPDPEILKSAVALIGRISNAILFRRQNCSVGASIGISFVNHKQDSLKLALTDADIALDHAKAEKKGAAALFHPSMRIATIKENEMVQDIQVGLKKGEFFPFFQPQIDTASGRVVGFESLIRWQHPKQGTVSAFNFLKVAQDAGMAAAIDDIVMDQSCRAARHLIDNGYDDACISINLSKFQVVDPQIVVRIQEHIAKHKIEPRHISIELLESTLLDEGADHIVRNVHALISAGFSVELDDFGTGHAAIATLRKFNVSRIKVDRSLIQDIDTEPELQVITSAVVDLAHRLLRADKAARAWMPLYARVSSRAANADERFGPMAKKSKRCCSTLAAS